VAEKRSAVTDAAGQPAELQGPVAATRRKTPFRFYVCVGILVLAAVSMQSVASYLGGYFRKAAVPLKHPLDALDQHKLLPEYRPHRTQPEPLTHDMLENLGTEEYLQWDLVDEQRERSDPRMLARLFITYYTGQPDMVPHRPKECIAAGGATLRDETLITVSVPGSGGRPVDIPVSVLEFDLPRRKWGLIHRRGRGHSRLVVAYFFHTNGRYVTSRTGVRRAVSNLWDRYAYYSKIEVSFTDDSYRKLADREETIEATGRLLRKLMPVLWEDHYQDWEALKSGAVPVILDRQG
jgi:hypothetical protein